MDQVTPDRSARRLSWTHRTTWSLLVLSSIALLGSSVYRAAALPLGIDESLSFAMFTGQPYWYRTAINHPLNTALMHFCYILFGPSELSLRLPNVAAHGLYLAAVLALVKRLHDPLLQVFGFVAFNLNLLLVEYFVVARGYGLALAFEMLSLYLFVRAYERRGQDHFRRDLYLSIAAGSLAVLSNFAWLNYYVPLVLACGWLLLTDGSLRRVSRNQLTATLVLLGASGLFLSYILIKLLKLQHDRQFYWGGYDGFVNDTIHSLARCSLHSALDSPAAVKVISAVLISLFLLLLPLGVRRIGSGTKEATFGLAVLLLAGAVVMPLLEHRFLRALFPIERAARYYLPLYAAVLVYALSVLRGGSSPWGGNIVAPVLASATAVVVGGWFCLGLQGAQRVRVVGG